MRIYIAPCGVGLGHARRCDVIANELATAGCNLLFSSYLDGLAYLRRIAWPTVISPAISFKTREDGTIDTKLTATQNGVTVGLWKFIKQVVSETRQMLRYDPHIVISDTRVSTILAGSLLGKRTILILNQYGVQMPRHAGDIGAVDKFMLLIARIAWKYGSTLLGLAWGLSSTILVPDYSPPFTVSKYNLSVPKQVTPKVKMIGPISRSVKANSRKQFTTGSPLVFACVSGPAGDRKHLVSVLRPLLGNLPDDVKVVLSCGDPQGSSIAHREGGLTVYEWMDQEEYDQIFADADVIVGRAGHGTIMKAVSEGKPLVLIPTPNHTEQANNSRRAYELGVAIVLEQAMLGIDSLYAAINEANRRPEIWPPELVAATKSQRGSVQILKLIQDLVPSRLPDTVTSNKKKLEPVRELFAR